MIERQSRFSETRMFGPVFTFLAPYLYKILSIFVNKQIIYSVYLGQNIYLSYIFATSGVVKGGSIVLG